MRDEGYTGPTALVDMFGGTQALLASVAGAMAIALGCSGGAPAVVAPSLEVPPLDAGAGERVLPLAPGEVRFGRAPPRVGARWHVRVEARSTAPDRHQSMVPSTYSSAYSVEVLASNGAAPSSVRLQFEQNSYATGAGEVPTSLQGKTYVLGTQSPFVRDANGGPVPGEEIERVLDIFPELGTRTQIDQVLPEASMRIGDERNELAAAVLSVIHPRSWTLNFGAATLTSADGEAAYFTTTIDATARSGVRMRVKGEVRIRVEDARLISLLLSGTYTEGDGSDAEGIISIRRSTRDL